MTLQITEPMTMVTDYLLAVFSAGLAISLLRKAGPRSRRPTVGWVVAFAMASVAALAGGTAHGFKTHLGPANHSLVWNLTIVSIGLTAVLMLLAGILSAKRPTTTDGERRLAGHQWLKGGIAVSVIGLLVQRSGWSAHQLLNHNDIYHLIQMVGIYFFYRGALVLHDL